MDTNSKEVFRRIIKHKQELVRKRVFDWDKMALRKKQKMEAKERVYLMFGALRGDSVPTSLYVGKTKQDLDKRFAQHMREIRLRLDGVKNWSVKYRWMYEMINREQDIRIILLNKVQRSKVYMIENEWIYYFGIHNFNMINRANFMHYNKKVLTV